MTLGELIAMLSRHDPNKVVRCGFGAPHSYRGYYEQLAFEPMERVRVGDMLADATSALGATFEGYKGGEYRMDEETDCWLAFWGMSGEMLGSRLLGYMLADVVPAPTDEGEEVKDA